MTLCASLSPNRDPAPLEWIEMIARLVILGPLQVLVTSFSALKWFSSLKLRAYWVEVVDLIPDNRVFCMNTLICIYRYCEMTEAKCVQASLLSPRNDLQRQGCSSRLIVYFRYICWFSVLTDLTVPQTQSLISRPRSSLILVQIIGRTSSPSYSISSQEERRLPIHHSIMCYLCQQQFLLDPTFPYRKEGYVQVQVLEFNREDSPFLCQSCGYEELFSSADWPLILVREQRCDLHKMGSVKTSLKVCKLFTYYTVQ